MVTLTITRKNSDVLKVAPSERITLRATAEPPLEAGSALVPTWELDGRPRESAWEITFDAGGDTVGKWTAWLEIDGHKTTSNELNVSFLATPVGLDPSSTGAPGSEPLVAFRGFFAFVTALITIAVGVGLLFPVGRALWLFRWDQLTGDQAAAKLGGAVALALILVGSAALLAGVWLGLVEGRGRMVSASGPAARGVPFSKEMIEAIGKLRGASLLLVSGVVVLLSAAWIAQSAVDPTGASPTPKATPSSTANPATGDDASAGPSASPSTVTTAP